MKYIAMLPDLNKLFKKHMSLLYKYPTLKTIFPQGYFNSVFKRNQSLNELLASSLYPKKKLIRANVITNYKNYLIHSNYFTCSVTNRWYYRRDSFILIAIMLFI